MSQMSRFYAYDHILAGWPSAGERARYDPIRNALIVNALQRCKNWPGGQI